MSAKATYKTIDRRVKDKGDERVSELIKKSKSVKGLYDRNAFIEACTITERNSAKAISEGKNVADAISVLFGQECRMNPGQRLRFLNKYVPMLLDSYQVVCTVLEDSLKINAEIMRNIGENSRKRWTAEDDELLIERMTMDNAPSISQIAAEFGRTPSAIMSRVTLLVGRNRVSQEIVGRFIGFMDGDFIEAELDGELFTRRDA